MTVIQRLQKGLDINSAKHDEGSLAKLGLLRAGSSGVVLPNGDLTGKCARVAHLRALGIEEKNNLNTKVIFLGGYANEAAVEGVLRASLAEDEVLEVEPELRFSLPSGLVVGGRPDLLLRKKEGQAVHGVELKNVSSLWTARDVHYDLVPKSDHLVQAGLYSLALGKLSYSLLYSSYSQFHLSTAPDWLQKKFRPGAKDVEFRVNAKTGKEEPLKILSFFREYELTWDGDFLCYQTEGLDKRVKTKVSLEAIDKFYQLVDNTAKTKMLPPRPGLTGVHGKPSFNLCDYCHLKPECDAAEEDYNTWLDRVLANPDSRRIT